MGAVETTPRTHVLIALLRAHRRAEGGWIDRGELLALLNDVSVADNTLRDTLDALEEAGVLAERDHPDDARRTQYQLLLDAEHADERVEERLL